MPSLVVARPRRNLVGGTSRKGNICTLRTGGGVSRVQEAEHFRNWRPGAQNGFAGMASLSCAIQFGGQGTPNDPPTCSLNPSQVEVSSSGTATSTLTVSTTASMGSAVRRAGFYWVVGAVARLCPKATPACRRMRGVRRWNCGSHARMRRQFGKQRVHPSTSC
jgi:hypothetical protein